MFIGSLLFNIIFNGFVVIVIIYDINIYYNY